MLPLNGFVNPALTLVTLDTYVHRSRLAAALQYVAPSFSGVFLDVGCGQMPYRETILRLGRIERYLGLDLAQNPHYRNEPDLLWDGGRIPLPQHSVDCAMAIEVLEHCPEPEKVLREIARVLRPGGILFFSVPFLWPLHNVPDDQYRYTPFAMERHLESAGFTGVRMHALGSWDASLAQMLGLYVRRRPMPGAIRLLLSLLAYPFVFMLSRRKIDFDEQKTFAESEMISGVCGTACARRDAGQAHCR